MRTDVKRILRQSALMDDGERDDLLNDPTMREMARRTGVELPENRTFNLMRDHAFSEYLRSGDVPKEHRDMGQASGAAGGYLVAPTFFDQLLYGVRFAGAFGSAHIWRSPNGAPATFPVLIDTSTSAAVIGEDTQATEGDFVLAQRSFGSAPQVSANNLLRVSIALAKDSAYDVEAMVKAAWAARMGRYADAASVACILAGTSIGYFNQASLSMGYDQIMQVFAKLDQFDLGNAVFVCHPTLIAAISRLTDSAGRPLAVPGTYTIHSDTTESNWGGVQERTLNVPTIGPGVPLLASNALAPVAVSGGGICAVLGNMDRGLVWRVVESSTTVDVLLERYSDFGQRGYRGDTRFDCVLGDTNALVTVSNHA
jgi:HK97 family phage major capsid protein